MAKKGQEEGGGEGCDPGKWGRGGVRKREGVMRRGVVVAEGEGGGERGAGRSMRGGGGSDEKWGEKKRQ